MGVSQCFGLRSIIREGGRGGGGGGGGGKKRLLRSFHPFTCIVINYFTGFIF